MRIEQVNELIQEELALAIARDADIDNALVTISYVDCSPDLNIAKIGVSVLPDRFAGSVLDKLRRMSSHLSHILLKKTKLRHIPKFVWQNDVTERNAAVIEDVFKQIKEEAGK